MSNMAKASFKSATSSSDNFLSAMVVFDLVYSVEDVLFDVQFTCQQKETRLGQ